MFIKILIWLIRLLTLPWLARINNRERCGRKPESSMRDCTPMSVAKTAEDWTL